jgi:aryl-phospho-beta-D-glucosidase BglC (GH1 family)
MNDNVNTLSFLRVSGSQIVDEQGQEVRLRGVSLGGWLNQENFITGFPGNEAAMRRAVEMELGRERAAFFFERFLSYFITEADLRYIRSLGLSVIRVPFNYRLFEDDMRPFEYKDEGFRWLDRVIGWARAHKLYVILDLHAYPGCQNRGWHSDNPSGEAGFWGQKCFEDRAIALWSELARRYRDEPTVAGYNVMNEPDADDVHLLNAYYRRATDAIRAIDTRHILFLEGNRYSKQFDVLDAPFDANTVYSSHNYVEPGLNDWLYPGTIDDTIWDSERLAEDYERETSWVRAHGCPSWAGEFGSIYAGKERDAMRLRATGDMIDIFEHHRHLWTLWTYKDLGLMGLVYLPSESEWMRRTQPVREAKRLLRCDAWIERAPGLTDQPLQALSAALSARLGEWLPDAQTLGDTLLYSLGGIQLSQALLPAFARQFNGMSETQIDTMMQSFAFENCVRRDYLAQVLQRACR